MHSLETGTMLVGGHVVRHKSSFKQGDKLFVQCTVIPPHPDMVIECNLHDADDRVLDRPGGDIAKRHVLFRPILAVRRLRADTRAACRPWQTDPPGASPIEADSLR